MYADYVQEFVVSNIYFFSIQICVEPSIHLAYPYMVSLKFHNDFHLVYTADTRPNKALNKIGIRYKSRHTNEFLFPVAVVIFCMFCGFTLLVFETLDWESGSHRTLYIFFSVLMFLMKDNVGILTYDVIMQMT